MKYSSNQLTRDIDIISNGLDKIDKKKILSCFLTDDDFVGEEVAAYLIKLEEMLECAELKELSNSDLQAQLLQKTV